MSGRSSTSWRWRRTDCRRRSYWSRHSPDVLFLDIQMPGCSGLEVARAASGRCHVVFVTGYDQHAVSGVRTRRGRLPDEAGHRRAAVGPRAIAWERLNAKPADLDALVQQLADTAVAEKAYLRWINVESRSEGAARDRGGDLLLPRRHEIHPSGHSG